MHESKFALPPSPPIDKITLHTIAMPLVETLQTSFGGGDELRPAVLVELHLGGAVGWGEFVGAHWTPAYSYETPGTGMHVISDYFIPAVLGKTSLDGIKHFRGHPMSRMALEAAYWSAYAAWQGKNIGELFGVPNRRDKVVVGVSIGIKKSIDATIEVIDKRLKEGYTRIKLKIKPGWDIELLRAVRKTYPNILLMADANSAYTLDDTPLFKQMDDLNLLMIEQPLGHDDIYQHSKLQPQLKTPICLDESIRNADDVRLALETDAGRIINLKPGRVGGIVESLELHQVCYDTGTPLWIGGMLETGIGRAANMAIASQPGVTLPSDLSATNRYYDPDLIDEIFTLNKADSTIDVPAGPGLGVTVNQERLAAAEAAFAGVPKTPFFALREARS